MADVPIGTVPAPAPAAESARAPSPAAAHLAARTAKLAAVNVGLRATLAAEKSGPADPAPTTAAVTAPPEAAAVVESPPVEPAKVETADPAPDADTSKRLDVVAKAEKRSRDAIAAEKAEIALERAELARLRADTASKVSTMDDLRALAKKNPLEALKRLGLESEDDLEVVARASYAVSKSGKADPKNKAYAEQVAEKNSAAAELAELRKMVAETRDEFSQRDQKAQAEQFKTQYLDAAVKAVPVESHAALALKANPERLRGALLALGQHMEQQAMREDGATKYDQSYTPSHAAVVAEYERRTVADLKDQGFTDAEIAARLKPAPAAKPVVKALDITAPTGTRVVDPNPDRKAKLAAVQAGLSQMFKTAT